MGKIKLYKWVQKIINEFCEEQEIDKSISLSDVNKNFFTNIHDSFFYYLPNALHKIVGHIMEARIPLRTPL